MKPVSLLCSVDIDVVDPIKVFENEQQEEPVMDVIEDGSHSKELEEQEYEFGGLLWLFHLRIFTDYKY